jgi:hypothetical protein
MFRHYQDLKGREAPFISNPDGRRVFGIHAREPDGLDAKKQIHKFAAGSRNNSQKSEKENS